MSRRRMEEELERDIQEHIAMETEDNIARGMSPSEARYAALRKFGNVARVKEDTRSVWAWAALDTWLADLRHAFRRIRRSPGPPAIAVLSLALAFAPSVTVFSIMDALFLSSSGIPAPQEVLIVSLRDTRPNASQPYTLPSYPEFQDLRRSLRSFSGLTYQYGKGAMVALRSGRSIHGVHVVSDDYFNVLGVRLQLGPGLRSDRLGAVISHGLWMREFDGRPDVIGRPLLVNGESFTIEGVAPAEFRGVERFLVVDLWVPVEPWLHTPFGEHDFWMRRDIRGANVWGRLRPGVSAAAARAELESAYRDLALQWPASNRYISASAYPLAGRERDGVNLTSLVVVLFGVLLAVACANVTGILLARAEERRHETAVRQTLGASRGRLMREWMIESAVLAIVAAALGLAGARALMSVVPGLVPTLVLPLNLAFSFGPHVWIYAAALVVVSTLSFGVVPAWRGSRPDLLSGLRRDSAVSLFRVRVPVRSLLIVLQVAAAEFFLFCAGMALDMASATSRRGAGFDPARPIVTATVLVSGDDAGIRPIDRETVCDRLTRVPGIRRVAYGRTLPLSLMGHPTVRLQLPGREPREIAGGATGPGFLSTLGVRFLSGRDLERADSAAVVVNSTLARQLDPSGAVVGRDLRLDGAIRHIVGVFEDVKWATVYDSPRPHVIALTPARSMSDSVFIAEVNGNPDAWVAAFRNELAAAVPGAQVLAPKTLTRHYQDALFLERSATRLFYGLGGIALLLTLTGLHGIASALFVRRSREFAIRLALGAPPRRIVAGLLGSGLKLAACGVALALVIALPAALYIAANVPGFTPWSLPALALSSAAVIAAALVAAAQPAARVLRIAPGDVIRSE